ncbi:VOC family protein [Streptomyces sp. NPDC012888]|uniref:VOC family protein n=1 Tax=Streptomyces sp. NPDC012888 TaxID=3364855 RepID=UPI0036B59237
MPDKNGPYKAGTPCWIDLMVPDQQSAIDFYSDLFGWTGEVGPPETGGYAVCQLKGRPVAGIMAAMNPDGSTPDPMPPAAWTTYLATDSADATEKAVRDAGGQAVMPPMDVMNLGRMAVFADPQGAVFGVWEAREFYGAGIVNEHGALIWNELNTSDPDAAGRFYGSVLPIAPAPSEVEGAEGYVELKVDGRAVGGLMDLGKAPAGTPPHWMAYFNVDDPDGVVVAAVRAGATVLAPPFDMVAGRMAVLADPQGAVFSVIAAKAPEQPV